VFTIRNDDLTLSILDPIADRERFGPRYCTGGYIFQIEDAGEPVLTGPTYPESFNWFDGQGIPDSFALGPLRPPASPDRKALIPGIGLCDLEGRAVLQFCEWAVDNRPDALSFRTEQAWDDFSFELRRTVSLDGRTVSSQTGIRNTGRAQIPLRWFPHPFFPLPDGPDLCALPAPVSLPDGTTYSMGPAGYLRCSDIGRRMSVPVACGSSGPLVVLQRHRRLGLIVARFSYPAGHIIVWGNERTFSFEPYLERTVGVGADMEWRVEYHF
jgi:hypothetical protein